MNIRHAVFAIALPALMIAIVGCDDYPESTQTFDINTQPARGSNLRLLAIASDSYYFDSKQNEVRPKFVATVNRGKYNIISTKTSYSSGYLTAAEITYEASGRGDGNNIRILLISSNKYHWDRQAADIKPRLDEVVNAGTLDIVKINTTYVQGYVLAAEVYHREKH